MGTCPPFAAVGVKVCQRSLNCTSSGRPPYMYAWNFAAELSDICAAREGRRKRTDRGLGLADDRELHDARALGARAVEQDLRELDLARRLEELDEVLVCG